MTQATSPVPSVPAPPTTQTAGEDTLKFLVRRGRALSAEIKDLQEELEGISDRVKALTKPGDKLEIDGVPLTHKRANRSFSKLLAFALLTPEERKGLMKEMLDEKALRALIESKGLLDDCMDAPKADAKTSVLWSS